MTLADWLPSLGTTGLLAAALWLGRNLILTRLSRSVSHDFDLKIEAIRSQLRASEESLKADLRAKESEIALPRSGALTTLANRQAAVDKRRLEAVDQIWASVSTLGSARQVSKLLASLKYEEAAKEAERNPKMREVLEAMGKMFDPSSMDLNSGEKARPFATPMVWAQYSALIAICTHAVARYQVLKIGLGAKDFVDTTSVKKLLKLALPHQATYIDDFGPSAFHFLLEELESNLLRELSAMLAGSDVDRATLAQAAAIVAASNEVLQQVAAQRDA